MEKQVNTHVYLTYNKSLTMITISRHSSNFACLMCVSARDYLASVSDFVLKNKGKRYVLKNPVGATLRIAALDDTIYRDDNDVVNGWGKFYLPKTVNMQVFAIVEGVSCPCDQLVLMTCEEKKVYGYDEEGLHLVATSLDWLRVNGLKYPPLKTYYKGEAFKDMVNHMLHVKKQEFVIFSVFPDA